MGNVLMLVGAVLILSSVPTTFRRYRNERKQQGAVTASTNYGVFVTLAILTLASSSLRELHPTASTLLALTGCALALVSLYFAVRAGRQQRAARPVE